MSTSSELAYVDSLRAEHRRLERLIRRTLAAFPSWEEYDAQEWMPRMTEGLVAIRTELAHHFHDEEQGGCLEEAVAHHPELSGEVLRIEARHEELLEPLDELIGRCQSACQPTHAQVRALEMELHQLVRELRLHEALENRVIQQGFGVAVDDELPAAHPLGAEPLD